MMPGDTEDALTHAIARNAGVVLSLPSAGMLRNCKSRFLTETEQGLWLESVPAEHPLIKELIAAGQNCGVSFKLGDRKVNFVARVLELNPLYSVNETIAVPAILLQRPPDVRAAQRRTNYRVKVPSAEELKLQMWRIPTHVYLNDKPPRTAELAVELIDLSVGGIGANVLPKDDAPPKIVVGERVRVLIRGAGHDDLLLEGLVRTVRPGTGRAVIIGVQFTKLQDGLEGRRITSELTKIVNAMQLDEVRRRRQMVG